MKKSKNDKLKKTDQEWQSLLTPEQYHVTREHGTEPAFSGEYNNCKDKGIYKCICCGNPLFHSDQKYDSGSGWPSFYDPITKESIESREDNSLFMVRTETVCANCDAHLGHVFTDGPQPTGLRYCMNSLSLVLEKLPEDD
ncbi:MAG: peptide-methionine (R)-S-oxide reductase [Rhodospirillaceae bacterium]|nr:peptide-methionine (R)-S-oxide reductase [Rhodospirillaceae bacterium]|tara:strand:+ start:1379 stop:1798 length:420 start_codon:yes stop_codon:yes gene_type:complete